MSVLICISYTELGVHSWVIIPCVNLTDNSQFCKTYCHTQNSSLHTALHSRDVPHVLPLSSLSAVSLGKRLCVLIFSSWYL